MLKLEIKPRKFSEIISAFKDSLLRKWRRERIMRRSLVATRSSGGCPICAALRSNSLIPNPLSEWIVCFANGGERGIGEAHARSLRDHPADAHCVTLRRTLCSSLIRLRMDSLLREWRREDWRRSLVATRSSGGCPICAALRRTSFSSLIR